MCTWDRFFSLLGRGVFWEGVARDVLGYGDFMRIVFIQCLSSNLWKCSICNCIDVSCLYS